KLPCWAGSVRATIGSATSPATGMPVSASAACRASTSLFVHRQNSIASSPARWAARTRSGKSPASANSHSMQAENLMGARFRPTIGRRAQSDREILPPQLGIFQHILRRPAESDLAGIEDDRTIGEP